MLTRSSRWRGWWGLVLLAGVGVAANGCIPDSDDDDGAGGSAGGEPCTFEGQEYAHGDQVPAADGCNTCECANGEVTNCTEVACPPVCTEEECGPAPGIPSFLCPDGVTMAGAGPCERQEGGQCGWTILECPEDPCEMVVCPEGQNCVDGACEGQAECTPETCGPAPGLPNMLCPDGETVAGPGPCERQENGECGWTIVECPADPCDGVACADGEVCVDGDCVPIAACADEACGPAPGLPNMLCPDGETVAGPGPCERQENGECGWTIVRCPPDPCDGVDCADDEMCVDGVCVAECGDDACGPAPGGIPIRECPDGETIAGVGDCERQENGECGWTIVECPEPGDPCLVILCEGGTVCVDGECVPDAVNCAPGENFVAGDGCNMCECPESGLRARAACTEAGCQTQCGGGADCPPWGFCDFRDDSCGVFGRGLCRALPQCPNPGGVPRCGCDGSFAISDCAVQSGGADVMRYGGCENPDRPGTFACGDRRCNVETEYCTIAANDAVEPGGRPNPEFFANCGPLPDDCPQGDCTCLDLPEVPPFRCYDAGGFSFAFDPGG